MKIEMTQSHYADATGFKLVGAGKHEVPDERGEYLVSTFPSWFTAVDGEDEPKQELAEQENNEPEAAQSEPNDSAPDKPVSKMNKDELQAYADELGVEVNKDMTNKDLQEAIKAHQES